MDKKAKYSIAVIILSLFVVAGFFIFLRAGQKTGYEISIPSVRENSSSSANVYPISDKSNGVLSFQEIYSTTTSRSDIKLFFEDDSSGEKILASDDFPSDSGLMWNGKPFLSGKDIYYPEDGKIKSIGIFTGEIKVIPIPVGEREIVNSFFLRGNKIYYLAGPSCLGYLEECNSSLNSYDLKSGLVESLASGSKSRDIIGFSKDGNILYLEQSAADAMCGRGDYEYFSFSDRFLKKIGSWSHCLYDSRKEEGEQPAVDGFSQTEYIVLKGGFVFVPATERYDGSEVISIRFNSADYSLKDPDRLFGGFMVAGGDGKKSVSNSERGLFMTIPGDWEVSDYNNKDSIAFYSPFYYSQWTAGDVSLGFKLDVFIEKKNTDLEEIKKEEKAEQEREPSLSYKEEEIEVAGIKSLKITTEEPPGVCICVKLPANGKLYTFIFYPGLDKDEHAKYFNEFLDTIFLK